jgi:hypothetical protein
VGSKTMDLLMSRLQGLDSRLLEDELYKLAWEEIERGELDPASQARSIADGEGHDGKTRSAYIRHRVRRLRAQPKTKLSDFMQLCFSCFA